MSDLHAEAGHLQLILHDDDQTPLEFVIDLLHSLFNKPVAEAIKFAETVDTYGEAICGTYPRDIANRVLEAARQRIHASGHPLRITSEAVADAGEMGTAQCKLCGALSGENRFALKGIDADLR
jgi:ATP-dependent Clp protease adapter protein ClpS